MEQVINLTQFMCQFIMNILTLSLLLIMCTNYLVILATDIIITSISTR